jgi:hypothetical protein
VSWNREGTCAPCRVKKSASLLTACIVFGVAPGEPFFHYGKVFLNNAAEQSLGVVPVWVRVQLRADATITAHS